MDIKKEVKLAYKKMKSYVYHENFSLDLRVDIAEYEANGIEAKLDELCKLITEYKSQKSGFEKLINKIDVRLFPKKFVETEYADDGAFYFSNLNKKETYQIDGLANITPFIDCPIDLHIISVLWIMRIGKNLDKALGKNCYGNRLVRDKDDEYSVGSIKLFKRYYKNYTAWRDDAIKKAKGLHAMNLDVAMLTIDVRSYYHSIDYDVSTIQSISDNEWLNRLLMDIHEKYISVLKKKKILSKDNNKKIIPIGLISSNIVANYYLLPFDKELQKKIKPEFYGRYVDDILLVFSNPQIDHNSNTPVNDFISKYLCNEELWQTKDAEVYMSKKQNNTDFEIVIGDNNLTFQTSKVKLYHFLSNESINVLNEFENEIKKNSSEFKFQPESNEIFDKFESSSFDITYSDTINKIRSIQGFTTNKYGASKHLSKLINATNHTSKLKRAKLDEIDNTIKNYFSGKRGLELTSLWEKVFTFYVINQTPEKLVDFARELLNQIVKLEFTLNDKQVESIGLGIAGTLIEHLVNCFSMAAALDKRFFNERIIEEVKDSNRKGEINKFLREITLENIDETSEHLIFSNLFRQSFTFYPLLNYCNQKKGFSFISKEIPSDTDFTFDKNKLEYSPRFIHYHEITLFYNLQKWFSNIPLPAEYTLNPLSHILAKYIEFNNLKYFKKSYENAYPQGTNYDDVPDSIITIKIKSKLKKPKLKFGLVNIKIHEENFIKAINGESLLNYERIDAINKVLNESINSKCDIIIFPEITIPYQWLPIVTDFARRNNIAVICGLEHFIHEKEAFNYVVTILPFNFKNYQNALVDFRLKIDYSHEEIEQLVGRNFAIPDDCKKEKLRLYSWKNIYFSVFNCFELTDIAKRFLFRGKVDFLATVEYNKDVAYFSNITESIARDIHAYIVQVNTSNFGDSRITRPAETYRKDIIKIKGGDSISIITGEIDVKSLREFQSLKYSLQKKDNRFKPTPPNFHLSEDRSK